MTPLAYTVRQCRICRGIYSWPIMDIADAMAVNYTHCAPKGDLIGTDFIEIRPTRMESVCCAGDAGE